MVPADLVRLCRFLLIVVLLMQGGRLGGLLPALLLLGQFLRVDRVVLGSIGAVVCGVAAVGLWLLMGCLMLLVGGG